MDYPDLNLDDLKKKQDEYNAKKGWLDVAGSIGQNLANIPTFGEINSGKVVGGNNVKGVTDAIGKSMVDPFAAKEQEMKSYGMQKQIADDKQWDDPNSQTSKAYKMYAIQKGWAKPEDVETMSAKDILRFGDPKKLREIEAQSQIEFNNQKQLREMDEKFRSKENSLNRQNDLEKIQTKAELDKLKSDAGAKLPSTEAGNLAKSSDALKDVVAFRDSAMATTDYSKAGKFNPLRMIPGTEDYTKTRAYENQAKAMMQKIGTYLEGGKLTDVDFESKYLPMAPQIDDPPELKKAKMDNLEKMVKQRLNAELESYGKAGYNVKNFSFEGNVPGNPVATKEQNAAKAVTGSSQPHPQDKEALSWAMKNPNDPRAKTILQSLGVIK